MAKEDAALSSQVAASEAALEEMGYKQELKRALTVPDLLIYGLIFMVPIAPFGIYGSVFQGSNGMPSLVYLIGMIAMIFTALSYSTLSQAFPVSGSVYGYGSRGVGKGWGFICGWAMLLDYVLVPTLLYVVAAVAMGGLVPGVPALVWGLLFVCINTFVNVIGIELTAVMNKVALVLELLVLAVFLTFGIVFIANGGTDGNLQFTIKPFYNADGFNLNVVIGAVSLGCLSFLGFDGIATLSEEAKDAKKGPGKAMIVALLCVGALFMAQTYVAGCIDPEGNSFATDPDNGFYLVAEIAGGKFLYALCAIATAIAWGIFNSLVAQTALSRIIFAMSRDSMLPHVLAKVHPKFKTPYIAAIVIGVLSLILVTIFESLGVAAISLLVNFGALTAFMLLNITIIWHFMIKQKSKNIGRHLILPLIGFAIIAYVWINLSSEAMTMGLIWMAVGIVYYLILHFVLKKDTNIEL